MKTSRPIKTEGYSHNIADKKKDRKRYEAERRNLLYRILTEEEKAAKSAAWKEQHGNKNT